MAATDARPIPRKNAAYRVTFPILDADGDLVTGAAGLDSEVSIDGGTFADCTNEATEIATASGMYYLDLTSAEMNGDTIAIIVKTSTSGAKTTPIALYPEEAGDVRVNVTAWNGTAVPTEDTAGYPKVTIKDGTGTGEIDTTSGKVAIATGGITVASFAAGAIDNAAIATDAIGSAELAASAVTEIQAGLSTLDAAAVRAAVGLAAANLDTQLTAIDDYIDTEIAAIKAKTDNLPTDPADASDIAASFSTVNTTLATIVGYIDTEVAAIKAKTDNLPASPAAVGDIPTANANADALLDRANAIETGLTLRQALRLLAAAAAGKLSGAATTTITIRNAVADSKARITATVDSDGNRSAITTDVT